MALSPNYGWAEPDNSSLVKNGAQDIRALGDAIDTSVWNIGYGQAGKNKIINGDFTINQRAFTSNTTSGYGFDRWTTFFADGTNTYTPQTFTAGAAPIAGYEATNFARIVSTGQTLSSAGTWLRQIIEGVRTFAGQTVTVSFFAKAATGTPKIAIECAQNFGSGGSASVNTYAGQATLSTSWARYSLTVAIPSISGKTIGTSNSLILNMMLSAGTDFNARSGSLGIQSNTFDIWGVQVEYGSKATPFQTASGGSPQAELAMCQRYYQCMTPNATFQDLIAGSSADSTAFCRYPYKFPVQMRVAPTLGTTGTASDYANLTATGAQTASSVPSLDGSRPDGCRIDLSSGGITIGQGTTFRNRTNYPSTFLTFSAEL
jgi:hypothetical protein